MAVSATTQFGVPRKPMLSEFGIHKTLLVAGSLVICTGWTAVCFAQTSTTVTTTTSTSDDSSSSDLPATPPREIFVRTYDTKTADAKTVLSTPQSYRPVPVNVTPDEDATETTTTTTSTTTTKAVSTGPRLGVEKPIDPRCQPFVTRGVALMGKASYEPAIKEFSEALRLDTESVPIRRYLAAALVANNLPSQAVDQIQIIFKQIAPTAYDKNLIGQAYLLQNKNLEAIGADTGRPQD